MSNVAFLNKIKAGCLESWRSHKVLPSLVAAQAILESNWGKSGLASKDFNLFGVKAAGGWKGAICKYPTKEFINGKYITVQASFRKYPSVAASIVDHALFLVVNKRYKKVLGEKNYIVACNEIKKAGYATDPKYTSKLIQIIEANKLHLWDKEVLNTSSDVKNPTPKPSKKFTSIIDYLNDKKQPSSFNARKILATKHGIKNYSGTAEQNNKLLNLLQK